MILIFCMCSNLGYALQYIDEQIDSGNRHAISFGSLLAHPDIDNKSKTNFYLFLGLTISSSIQNFLVWFTAYLRVPNVGMSLLGLKQTNDSMTQVVDLQVYNLFHLIFCLNVCCHIFIWKH